MADIIKRDKRRQKFSRAKLERSIILAARGAKLTTARGKQIAQDIAGGITKEISRRRSIKSTELRRKILSRLESRSKAMISAWRRYDRKY